MAYKGEMARVCWPTWALAQAQTAIQQDEAGRRSTLWRARWRDGFTPPPDHDQQIGG
jgi:hypothetical protein